jgi:hypothetical protein
VVDLRLKCRVVLDTSMTSGAEGLPERRIIVLLGRDSVAATIAEDRIWRIELTSLRFRTADSVGIGSTVRRLRRDAARILGAGEDGFYLELPRACGLSFRIAGVSGAQEWADIPMDATVDKILVFGCR